MRTAGRDLRPAQREDAGRRAPRVPGGGSASAARRRAGPSTALAADSVGEPGRRAWRASKRAAGWRAARRPVPAARDRCGDARPDPVHLRHDRASEGRDPDPREPRVQRAQLHHRVRLDRVRRDLDGGSDVPRRRAADPHDPGLAAGATNTIHRDFEPGELLADIGRRRITRLACTPAMTFALTAHRAWESTDLSSLRSVTTGSTVVPPSAIEPWLARGARSRRLTA